MSSEVLVKIDEIGKAWEATKATQDQIEAKIAKGEGEASELKAQMAKIDADLNSALDLKKRMEELEASTKRIADNVELAHKKADEKGIDLKAYGDALKKMVKSNWNAKGVSLSDAEAKALSSGVDADGGYTIEPFLGDMTAIMFDTSPMRSLATTIQIGSETYKEIIDDAEASAGWVAETAARPVTNTPTFNQVLIDAHEMYAFPTATEAVLEDSRFDLAPWLQMKVRNKFARLEATGFVTGSGTGQPKGITAYTTKTSNADQYTFDQLGTVAAAGAAAITTDELVDLRTLLQPMYRPNAYYVFNRATEGYIRKLKDGDGNYIWQPSYQLGTPDTLLGQRVSVFEDMPDIATGAVSVALGDFRSGYTIVDRVGISVLEDPYTQKPYRGFYIRKRVGGGVVDFNAIKLLEQA